jgi:Ras-related protein Rab-2A
MLYQLTIRLCEGRFSPHHDVTIGVEFGSRIVPVGPPASLSLSINNASNKNKTKSSPDDASPRGTSPSAPSSQPPSPTIAPLSKQALTKEQTAAALGQAPQKHMKLSCWDTAGQESYKSITRSYFRGASGALLVFDITRRATFNSVTSWLHDLRQIAEDNVIVVLVGNKSDLAGASTVEASQSTANKRQVTREEAEEWCRQNNVLTYVETSAKSGAGVENAFLELAERIYQNIEAGKYDLNDRRSGVKSAAQGGNKSRTVNLGVGGTGAGGKGVGGGCC